MGEQARLLPNSTGAVWRAVAYRMLSGISGGDDHLFGGAGRDSMGGDSRASVGDATGAGDDVLDGGQNTDDCDGEAGTDDKAKRCEVLAGVP